MFHDLFTIEIIAKPQGGLNNFEHNCMWNNVKDAVNTAKLDTCTKQNDVVELPWHQFLPIFIVSSPLQR